MVIPQTQSLPASRPRILVAEDQPGVREALRLLLKAAAYETEMVDSPRKALTALAASPFDAVLMDLNYTADTTSGREGLELLSRLRAFDSTLPVVVMTAWGSIDLAVEALQRGARDFVQKPWENERLLTILRAQIEDGGSGQTASSEDMELRTAREIQEGLLPRELPCVPGVELSASWEPARGLGGDYFDVLKLSDDRLGLCIADVMGKGLPAALLMCNLQAAVRAHDGDWLAPAELCRKVNQLMCENISAGRFISFFYGVLDPRRRRLAYSNAGHCPPLLARRSGCLELNHSCPVLGEFPEAEYEECSVALQPGDRLVLFTDGVTEARDPQGMEFGAERLARLAAERHHLRAEDMRAALMQAVLSYSQEHLEDDATLLVAAVT